MRQETDLWFAWYPVSTTDGKLAWLTEVMRTATLVHGRDDGCSEDVWYYTYKRIKE